MKALVSGLLVAMAFVACPVNAGPGPAAAPAASNPRVDRADRRMRLVRMLGIAEALDLDDAQFNQMREILNRQDEKRGPIQKQLRDDMQVLRRAATGDAAAQAQLDKVVVRVFDAREKLQKIDRETYEAMSKGLSAEKRARLMVFLHHFQNRFGPGMSPGRGATGANSGVRGQGMGGGMMGRAGDRDPGWGPFED
jgi:Spy/CpxP family protein refolding chaperone